MRLLSFGGMADTTSGISCPRCLRNGARGWSKGNNSAAQWNQDAAIKELQGKRSRAKELVGKSAVEQWAINSSVHFNEWANLDSHEFAQVVASFRELLENLRCEHEACKSYLYLSPNKGNPETLRCNCGSVNINLKVSN